MTDPPSTTTEATTPTTTTAPDTTSFLPEDVSDADRTLIKFEEPPEEGHLPDFLDRDNAYAHLEGRETDYIERAGHSGGSNLVEGPIDEDDDFKDLDEDYDYDPEDDYSDVERAPHHGSENLVIHYDPDDNNKGDIGSGKTDEPGTRDPNRTKDKPHRHRHQHAGWRGQDGDPTVPRRKPDSEENSIDASSIEDGDRGVDGDDDDALTQPPGNRSEYGDGSQAPDSSLSQGGNDTERGEVDSAISWNASLHEGTDSGALAGGSEMERPGGGEGQQVDQSLHNASDAFASQNDTASLTPTTHPDGSHGDGSSGVVIPLGPDLEDHEGGEGGMSPSHAKDKGDSGDSTHAGSSHGIENELSPDKAPESAKTEAENTKTKDGQLPLTLHPEDNQGTDIDKVGGDDLTSPESATDSSEISESKDHLDNRVGHLDGPEDSHSEGVPPKDSGKEDAGTYRRPHPDSDDEESLSGSVPPSDSRAVAPEGTSHPDLDTGESVPERGSHSHSGTEDSLPENLSQPDSSPDDLVPGGSSHTHPGTRDSFPGSSHNGSSTDESTPGGGSQTQSGTEDSIPEKGMQPDRSAENLVPETGAHSGSSTEDQEGGYYYFYSPAKKHGNGSTIGTHYIGIRRLRPDVIKQIDPESQANLVNPDSEKPLIKFDPNKYQYGGDAKKTEEIFAEHGHSGQSFVKIEVKESYPYDLDEHQKETKDPYYDDHHWYADWASAAGHRKYFTRTGED